MELTASNRVSAQQIFDLPKLRNRTRIFNNRQEAIHALVELLPSWYLAREPLLLAISSAGYTMAAELVDVLDLDVEFTPVQNVALPWDGEIDYAAVAFDGTVYLDDEMVERNRLGQREIEKGIERALATMRRNAMLITSRSLQRLRNRDVLLIDEGITTATLAKAAIKALASYQVKQLSLAAATAYDKALIRLSSSIEYVFCPNICSGYSYVAGDAYRQSVPGQGTKALHQKTAKIETTH